GLVEVHDDVVLDKVLGAGVGHGDAVGAAAGVDGRGVVDVGVSNLVAEGAGEEDVDAGHAVVGIERATVGLDVADPAVGGVGEDVVVFSTGDVEVFDAGVAGARLARTCGSGLEDLRRLLQREGKVERSAESQRVPALGDDLDLLADGAPSRVIDVVSAAAARPIGL